MVKKFPNPIRVVKAWMSPTAPTGSWDSRTSSKAKDRVQQLACPALPKVRLKLITLVSTWNRSSPGDSVPSNKQKIPRETLSHPKTQYIVTHLGSHRQNHTGEDQKYLKNHTNPLLPSSFDRFFAECTAISATRRTHRLLLKKSSPIKSHYFHYTY